MESYVPQILRKLLPAGIAFLHHSNFAALSTAEKRGDRGESVSGDVVLDIVNRAGGKVLVQELISWGAPSSELLDCLTILARKEHPHTAPPIVTENRRFMDEALIIRETHTPYCQVPAEPDSAHASNADLRAELDRLLTENRGLARFETDPQRLTHSWRMTKPLRIIRIQAERLARSIRGG
jgi:hypothetical protein